MAESSDTRSRVLNEIITSERRYLNFVKTLCLIRNITLGKLNLSSFPKISRLKTTDTPSSSPSKASLSTVDDLVYSAMSRQTIQKSMEIGETFKTFLSDNEPSFRCILPPKIESIMNFNQSLLSELERRVLGTTTASSEGGIASPFISQEDKRKSRGSFNILTMDLPEFPPDNCDPSDGSLSSPSSSSCSAPSTPTSAPTSYSKPADCVGDIFFQFAPYFNLYASFMTQYDNAVREYDELMKRNPMFAEFVYMCREGLAEAQGQDLRSLLVMPIQRVPRYRLLLQELQSNTPPDHQDFGALEVALSKIKSAATQANQKLAEFSGRKRVLEIQDMLKLRDLAQSNRKLIKEGKMRLEVHKNYDADKGPEESVKVRDVEVFLFSDIVLFHRKRTFGTDTIQLFFKTFSLEVTETSLFLHVPAEKRAYELTTIHEEQMKQWTHAFRVLDESFSSRKNVRPLDPDEEAMVLAQKLYLV